jgi:hypothetical protein
MSSYLLHAWFKKQGIDYRYTVNEGGKNVMGVKPGGSLVFVQVAVFDAMTSSDGQPTIVASPPF